MGNLKQAGFTIVETTLFLGISSFLIVALIGATGNSVNIQRYKDSVHSFKGVLQQQYADISSVQNPRDDNWSCGSDAAPNTTGATKQNRGQSDCLLLGKYVRLEDDKISIYTVTGYQTDESEQSNDILLMRQNYKLNVSNESADKSTLEWGAKITNPVTLNGSANPASASPRKMGILIVRSPDSGQVYTFTNSGNSVPNDGSVGSAALASMLVAGDSIPGQGKQTICVSSDGLLANNDQAIVLSAFATGASAVEMQTNQYMSDNSLGTKC